MEPIVISNPKVMHGTPCFAGTRVPVKNLFDLLAYRYSLEYFLEQFPRVTREQATTVLSMAAETVVREQKPVGSSV